MGVRLRFVGGLLAGLILAGCSADYGVDQYGRKVPAASLDGQWLVINYWADWCAPCRKEVPELNALAKEGRDKGVRVVGVNYDGLRDAELSKAAEALGIQYTVLADDPAERFKLPRSEALPVTYIVDARGQVRDSLLGEQTASGVKARLQALQEEKR
ncbi:TlpA disulfide reductase family protein [Pseudomonas citronellolis]|uniref:TlpA disulfide reductase family protein n=1 Tax=Pseudomonas citronellolis TaxID=53408 RepID=UPI0023E3E92B|nr:TlpA disulfide reductase family protein [Pseudomonas citronellolis]MDF3932798.1 TlpA disulfide reductase family protein [Pseudomonas citronellolis]